MEPEPDGLESTDWTAPIDASEVAMERCCVAEQVVAERRRLGSVQVRQVGHEGRSVCGSGDADLLDQFRRRQSEFEQA